MAKASGDTLNEWLHTNSNTRYSIGYRSVFQKQDHPGEIVQKSWRQVWVKSLTTKELMDLRVILVRFMADKKAHKKIPRLVGRAPKLWDTVDRMYKYKLKGKEDEG